MEIKSENRLKETNTKENEYIYSSLHLHFMVKENEYGNILSTYVTITDSTGKVKFLPLDKKLYTKAIKTIGELISEMGNYVLKGHRDA